MAELKARASRHSRSTEAEVLAILLDAVSPPQKNAGRAWLDAAAHIRALGGIEIDVPPCEAIRPVEFD